MKKQLGFAFLISSLLMSLSALADTQPAPSIVYDTVRIPVAIQNMISADFNALNALQFGPNVDNLFRLYYGSSSQDIVRYLLERVHYVGVDAMDNDPTKLDPTTYAANYGASFLDYYYQSALMRNPHARPVTVPFNDTQIMITHPRVGFVGIGGAYVNPKTTQIDRIDTWVHEARHSDCPSLPNATDMSFIVHGQDGRVSVAGQVCSYAHVPCPKGHPLAGELACDVVPWGAYSAGYIFAKNVFKACTNCTEEQKQAGLASATDDYSRLFPILRQFYSNSNPAAPNMTSFDARPATRR